MLLLVSTVEAKSTNKLNSKTGYYGHRYSRPVTFVEKGVKFYIYLDGEMDFEIMQRPTYYGTNSYYGNSYYRGKSKNRKNGARHSNSKTKRHGISDNFIHYDYHGRINRIGNTHIAYNYFDQVVRINGIFITYRHHDVTRVGQLRIVRTRYGDLRYIGSVKPRYYYHSGYYSNFYNDYFYDDFIYDWNDDFFENDDFFNEYEQFQEDDDFYYYRSKRKQTKRGKTGKAEKKQKLIKRRKAKKPTNQNK